MLAELLTPPAQLAVRVLDGPDRGSRHRHVPLCCLETIWALSSPAALLPLCRRWGSRDRDCRFDRRLSHKPNRLYESDNGRFR
jgi:hypothetical protein